MSRTPRDTTTRPTDDPVGRGAFPTATLVVGVGTFGQHVLHQLAERWTWVAGDNPDDPTLGHLSLLHVAASEQQRRSWDEVERTERTLAAMEGDGDEPDLALNLLILRTLGLVRVHHGVWEVAQPVDDGPISLSRDGAPPVEGQRDRAQQPTRDLLAVGQTPHRHAHVDTSLTPAGWRAVVEPMSSFLPIPDAVQGALDDERARGDDPTRLSARRPSGGLFAGHRTFRRRTYRWLPLGHDPLTAARQLADTLGDNGELARFVEPLLARVRDGNSPQILLQALRRLRAWHDGRDPSPWRWRHLPQQQQAAGESAAGDAAVGDAAVGDAAVGESTDTAQPDTEQPDTEQPDTEQPDAGADRPVDRFDRALFGPIAVDPAAIHAHPMFQPRDSDTPTPIEPWVLLSLDWQTPGWTFNARSAERRVFRALPGSPAAFGFYDTDRRLRPIEPSASASASRFDAAAWYAHAQRRMGALADDAHRGLVRLWGQLTRLRQHAPPGSATGSELDETRVTTLRESLELLGEYVVRDVLGSEPDHPVPPHASHGVDRATPSPADVRSPRADDRTPTERLDARLATLLGERPAPPPNDHVLHTQVDIQPHAGASALGHDAESRVRAWVNGRVRSILSASRLGRLPRPPGDMPVYVRVFIVGDLGESVVRQATRPLLQVIHGELLRAVMPIYDGRFDGHTRPLTVTPLLSMPHPADPFDGSGSPGEGQPPGDPARSLSALWRRAQERLIVDAVHELRRWVEVIPGSERLTFEVLVNGRVTDRAVMTREDAVEELRAFIWMTARNVTADDPALNQLLSNRNGDVLSTFACRELSFPAERARAWIANRSARGLLRVFTASDDGKHAARARAGAGAGDDDQGLDRDAWQLRRGADVAAGDPAPEQNPLQQAVEDIEQRCSRLRTRLVQGIRPDKLPVQAHEDAEDLLLSRFSETRRDELLYQPIITEWRDLSRHGGAVDGYVTDVRRSVAIHAAQARVALTRATDDVVTRVCPEQGANAMRHALLELRRDGRSYLDDAERERSDEELGVVRHKVPDPSHHIGPAWEELRAAIGEKPDLSPMRFARVATAAALALALGPVLVVLAGTLPFQPGPSINVDDPTWLVSRVPEVLLAVALFLVADRLIGWWMNKSLARIETARDALEAATEQALTGTSATSVRPFFTTRLRHRWALARKGHALRAWERVERDRMLAERVRDAAEARRQRLQGLVEGLGVRVRHGEDGLDRDDPAALFDGGQGDRTRWLVTPDHVDRWYRERVHTGRDEDSDLLRQELRDYFTEHPLASWRQTTPFGDDSLELFTRERWAELVDEAIVTREHVFRSAAQRAIAAFVSEHFGAIGYGAKFRGYEGLDEDGIDDSELRLLVPGSFEQELRMMLQGDRDAHEALNLRPELRHMLERVKKDYVELRPNGLYLLMVALGIRERSFQNLHRFLSVHERSDEALGEQFPLSPHGAQPAAPVDRAVTLHRFSHIHLPELTRPAGPASGGRTDGGEGERS